MNGNPSLSTVDHGKSSEITPLSLHQQLPMAAQASNHAPQQLGLQAVPSAASHQQPQPPQAPPASRPALMRPHSYSESNTSSKAVHTRRRALGDADHHSLTMHSPSELRIMQAKSLNFSRGRESQLFGQEQKTTPPRLNMPHATDALSLSFDHVPHRWSLSSVPETEPSLHQQLQLASPTTGHRQQPAVSTVPAQQQLPAARPQQALSTSGAALMQPCSALTGSLKAIALTNRGHDHSHALKFGINSMVQVSDPPRFGVIRWIGEMPGIQVTIAGVELVSSRYILDLCIRHLPLH